ncbi:tyrosine-type recombinase/integrase [uncultured Ruegeria sp.]|uniref:tyrosine-type recombinase/integrase n=1 Tax=uncultured Ruegeria sp. TaxID=259304 RepID=UPI0026089AFA|nr:tyrosine-type recombinase/integrase [uncultured Ruegeria sp.]
MSLTTEIIETFQPTEKRYRKSDENGLFLEVSPNGSKTWKLAYRFQGGQRSTVLGSYPELSLEEARLLRTKAKVSLRAGVDPYPKPEKVKAWEPINDDWADVAKEYRDRRVKQGMALLTQKKMEILIRKTLPGLGDKPVKDIKPLDLLPILRQEEANGHYENATRLRTLMGQIFRYAIATGRAEFDPSRDLKGAVLPPAPKHHSGLTDRQQIGGLMRAIRGFDGSPTIRAALLLLAYSFVRPGELRLAKWSEIEDNQWVIPEARMKSKRKHIVPLADQTRELLSWLRPYTCKSEWIFPQRHNLKRAMSDGTLNAALRRMGYDSSEHVPHGFRTTASTILNENNWNPDWIEAQLAHVQSNKVRAAYNAAQYIDGRVEMMRWWADWLDNAEAEANSRFRSPE